MSTRRGLFLFAALTVSACTQEAAVTPSTSAADIASTDSGPAADTTTTVAPDTTTPTETTVEETADTAAETTTTAPTTTLAPTGNPTSVSTEYFIGGDPDAWLYLGRWTGNDWESDRNDDQQFRQPTAADGDAVVVHEIGVDPIDGTIDGSGEACAADGRTGPVIAPNARAPQDPGFGYRSIAFAADWPTQPRRVAVVDADVESYLAAGRAAFDDLPADSAVDVSTGVIQQLVVADLDADGDTEAIVAFGNVGFSTLLLIDADSGASTRIARSVAVRATPTTASDGDASAAPTEAPAAVYRTLALSDLDGDGRFEIVSQAFQRGRAEVTVSTYDGAEVTAVLSAGC